MRISVVQNPFGSNLKIGACLRLSLAALGVAFVLSACAKDEMTWTEPEPPVADSTQPLPTLPEAEAEKGLLPKILEDSVEAMKSLPLLRDRFAVDDGSIRVALLVPLTGPHRKLGQALRDAAEMALFDIGDERLMLLPRDTGGTAAGAREAAADAIAQGAHLILGPLFAQSAVAAAEVARPAGVAVVAFSTDRSVAGDGVYLLGFMVEEQVTRVVDHAYGEGLLRFATLAPDTPYGQAVVGALETAARDRGGVVSRLEIYPPTETELAETVKRLADYDERREELLEQRRLLEAREDSISKQALKRLERLETIGEVDFDAILLPEGGGRLKSIAPLLAFYEIDPAVVRYLGTGLWDDPSLSSEPSLIGGWFAGAPPKLVKAFESRFAKTYGSKPERLASLAYDGLALTAALIRDRGVAGLGSYNLTNPAGFAGYNGIFRFRENGVVERGLAVIEVRKSGFKVISDAPTSFQVLTN